MIRFVNFYWEIVFCPVLLFLKITLLTFVGAVEPPSAIVKTKQK